MLPKYNALFDCDRGLLAFCDPLGFGPRLLHEGLHLTHAQTHLVCCSEDSWLLGSPVIRVLVWVPLMLQQSTSLCEGFNDGSVAFLLNLQKYTKPWCNFCRKRHQKRAVDGATLCQA